MDSIDVLEIPSATDTWESGKNYTAQALRLEDSIPEDPQIAKLF